MMRGVLSFAVFVFMVGAAVWLQFHFPDMKEAVLTILGALIALGGTWFFTSRDTEKAARYLAIRVVCVLDKFMEDCLAVVKDDGLSYGSPNKYGCLEPQIKSPGAPVFPDDVDWKSIDPELMYKILSLPSNVEAGDNAIAFSWDIAGPPDYDEYFDTRAFWYGCCGMTAYKLIQELSRKYGIPKKTYINWNPAEELEKELRAIQKKLLEHDQESARLIDKVLEEA